MEKHSFRFHTSFTNIYFQGIFTQLKDIVNLENTVFITDENIYRLHQKKFNGKKIIVLKPGEKYKTQDTVNVVIKQLLELQANRSTTLVGVGGGVVTDITGYIASIYMRGLPFGFVPTTLLAMVDACIGGKNGVDLGIYKNMVGTINQPSFILYDYSMLNTLPQNQWECGFAEIIKHACIKDAQMFNTLQLFSVAKYKKNKADLATLIQHNARLKIKVVQQDEHEKGDRKYLNFGHTIGHAIENQYKMLHGHAVALGMLYACKISTHFTGFQHTQQVQDLLQQYNLPTTFTFDMKKTIDILQKDKKIKSDTVSFIMLTKIGKATIQTLPLHHLETLMQEL